MKKKIVFLTGTRADFGKLKPLIDKVEHCDLFECHIFVTGMHLLSKYGSTYYEIENNHYKNVYKFINQADQTKMDIITSNTILGFSNYVNELKPDMIVVHGDRIEAFAAALVGALNNVLVAHIEGGELSGTIDDSLRHSISKLAHIHFVANSDSAKRLKQMGENKENIFVIGSPDIDVVLSDNLPTLSEAKKRYDIPFDVYSIFCFHPVTTELDRLERQIKEIIGSLANSGKNYVCIYPNNDEGSGMILDELLKLEGRKSFRILPSMRFEYFLSLLKNAEFMIGNSSSGIREASIYGVPSINIGTRQMNRSKNNKTIFHVEPKSKEILKAIDEVCGKTFEKTMEFGNGKSAGQFFEILKNDIIWKIPCQKQFIDQDIQNS